MCFAWCQKTKRNLERKEVLVNLKSVYKKWSLFKCLLSVVEIACFVLYNHYGQVHQLFFAS